MIKPIMHDRFFLSLPSEKAGAEDVPLAQDLLDTLSAHRHECVGMAANMIGRRKRVIAVMDGDAPLAMLNPEILEKAGAYQTEEGCLSLPGQRPVVRYRTVKVRYLDVRIAERTRTFSGWTAQIIQHEIDHCDGILV